MLYNLMRECRNYFPVPGAAYEGEIKIEGGEVCPLNLLPGQYFIVEGSVLNDGLHQSYDALDDETFYGRVVPLAVPKAFIALAERIAEWNEKNGHSVLQSESFGGYSYNRGNSKSGGVATWKDAFDAELAEWRKL